MYDMKEKDRIEFMDKDTKKDEVMKKIPTMDNDNYALMDGEAQNKKFPESFHIPTLNDRQGVGEGDVVKLVFEAGDNVGRGVSERMWVIITQKEDDFFVGILDNDPYIIADIESGQEVHFESRHIIGIYED